jgi:hypothetical protein
MPRIPLFNANEPLPFTGIGSATEPGEEEPVCSVIDLLLLGGIGDGKTQLLVHLARTLDARIPELRGKEADEARDLLRVVLDVSRPTPEPTAPGRLRHHVLRVSARALVAMLSPIERLLLARRIGALGRNLAAAICAAGVLLTLTVVLRGAVDLVGAGLALLALVGWLLAALWAAQVSLGHAGEVELVLWDLAGQHVLGGGAADVHAAARTLIRRRRARQRGRRYAFAPVLLCNPLALGTEVGESTYAGLRELLPLFSALGGERTPSLLVRTRWQLARELCPSGADCRELVTARVGEQWGRVRRGVVRWYCFDDDEPGARGRIFQLHYDAGELLRTRRLRDEEGTALEVEYKMSPSVFDRGARSEFAAFLATLAFAEPQPIEPYPLELLPTTPAPEGWELQEEATPRAVEALRRQQH